MHQVTRPFYDHPTLFSRLVSQPPPVFSLFLRVGDENKTMIDLKKRTSLPRERNKKREFGIFPWVRRQMDRAATAALRFEFFFFFALCICKRVKVRVSELFGDIEIVETLKDD